jgi:hypothetical protein
MKKTNVIIILCIISLIVLAIILGIMCFKANKREGTLIEEKSTKSSMTEIEARVIAEKECIKGGDALEAGVYNKSSKTWWFNANLNATREGCNPACVVSEETKTAEINWRCTGLKQ